MVRTLPWMVFGPRVLLVPVLAIALIVLAYARLHLQQRFIPLLFQPLYTPDPRGRQPHHRVREA